MKQIRGRNVEASSFWHRDSYFGRRYFMVVLVGFALLQGGCRPAVEEVTLPAPAVDSPIPVPQPDRPEIEGLSKAQLRVLADGADRYCEALKKLGCRPSITVNLAYTEVTDADLAKLAFPAATRCINLSETHVGDDAIAGLNGLTGLQTLLLSSTKVSDRSVSYVQQLPQLMAVDLMNTQVSAEGQAAVIALVGARAANQAATPPPAPPPGQFQSVSAGALQSAAAEMDRYADAVAKFGGDVELNLDFSRLPLTDLDLRNLSLPKCVRGIDLSYTQVTDQALSHLRGAAPNLDTIALVNTAITDAGVKELMAMPRLCEAVLEGTNLAFSTRMELTQALAPHLSEKARRRGR